MKMKFSVILVALFATVWLQNVKCQETTDTTVAPTTMPPTTAAATAAPGATAAATAAATNAITAAVAANATTAGNTTTTTTTASPSTRRVVFSIGDPHIRSVLKGFETCNFQGTTNLISNSKITLDVTAVQISGQSVTVMTQVKLTFVSGNLTTTYTASNSTATKVPSVFDNQNATVLDSTGSKWLELTVISSNSFVYIKDYNSRSTIMVGFMFWHMVFVKTSESVLKTGGLLYSGCPSGQLNSSRRKRQTGTAACSTVTSSDPDIPTSSLQSACTTDATINPTLNIASGYSSAASAAVTMTSADNSAFGTASSGGGGGSSFSNSIHAFSLQTFLMSLVASSFVSLFLLNQ